MKTGGGEDFGGERGDEAEGKESGESGDKAVFEGGGAEGFFCGKGTEDVARDGVGGLAEEVGDGALFESGATEEVG